MLERSVRGLFQLAGELFNPLFIGAELAVTACFQNPDHICWRKGDEYLFLRLHTAVGTFFGNLRTGVPRDESWRGGGAVALLVRYLLKVLNASTDMDISPHHRFYDGSFEAGWQRYSLGEVSGGLALPVRGPGCALVEKGAPDGVCIFHVSMLALPEAGYACKKGPACQLQHPSSLGDVSSELLRSLADHRFCSGAVARVLRARADTGGSSSASGLPAPPAGP